MTTYKLKLIEVAIPLEGINRPAEMDAAGQRGKLARLGRAVT
jgi:hypothetical protein